MNKSELIFAIDKEYGEFCGFISSLQVGDFEFSLNGQKWTAGQQLDHLCRSVSPLNVAFGLPKFALRIIFGKSSRPSRGFDEVVAEYQGKLAAGGKATGRFIPKRIEFGERDKLIARLKNSVTKLSSRTEDLDEDQLDHFLLPHPILGKLSLREMLYFTIYHAGHHQKNAVNNLNGR